MSSSTQLIHPFSNKRKFCTVPESPLRQRKSCLKKTVPIRPGTVPNKDWVIKENPDYSEDASYKRKNWDAPKKDGEFLQICKYARANGFANNLFGCHDAENDKNNENKEIISYRYQIIDVLHVSEGNNNNL